MIHGQLYRTHPQGTLHTLLEKHAATLILDPLHQQLSHWASPQCWLATASEKSQTPHALTSIGTPPRAVITAWARLDNRDELAQLLHIRPNELALLSCADVILRAYLHFGEACTTHLYGDFSFAIYDVLEKRLFCARDQMGARPFYYYVDQHQFAFSSSLALFHKLDGITVRPCMEWASKFLVGHLSMDFTKSAYQHIFKLPPAHQVSITSTTVTLKRYYAFHTNKIQLASSDAYVEYYRAHLDEAIKCRAAVSHPLGSELSGGIDSSTVTAYALKHYQRPLNEFHTFGFAYFEHEPKHILSINQHFRIPMSYICCNISLFENEPHRALQALGAPVEHGNALSHEIFYDLAAKHQVRTLLSGFGGDEFVSSIHGNIYLHELLKNKQILTLYQNLSGNAFTRACRFAKLIYTTGGKAGIKNKVMPSAFASRWPSTILNERLIKTYGLKALHEARGQFDNGYHDLDQFTLENRWAPYVSTRMENCLLMAATYGVEYRWPLLDARLIQCFLSIPSCEKYHRGTGRYLHKRAIAPIVPKSITAQQSKYMGERMAQSIPKRCQLNDDLHPALASLIDMPKLRKQEQHVVDAKRCGPSQLTSPKMAPLRQNIAHVNQLDHWLKYYFNASCTWANTPEEIKTTCE